MTCPFSKKKVVRDLIANQEGQGPSLVVPLAASVHYRVPSTPCPKCQKLPTSHDYQKYSVHTGMPLGHPVGKHEECISQVGA